MFGPAQRLRAGASRSVLARALALSAAVALSAGAAHAQTSDQPLPTTQPNDAPAPDVAQPERTDVDAAGVEEATEDGTEVEAVVVTGFRRSLERALQIKREATGVVDSIVAEDIAKFPDNNLADAIGRVPGVTITRDGGEGRNISVRGLGPDFTRVRINGMEAQAISEGIGGTTRGRGFDFNVFASELFSRIDVHKTAAADLEEGSLGATVDLYTGRPLDYRGFVASASLKGSYSEVSGAWDPRAAFLISNRWDTGFGQFGALFSAAYSQTDRVLVGSNSGFWDIGTSNGGFCPPALARCAGTNVAAYNLANSVNTWHPRFLRFWENQLDQERLGITTALQWRPSERTQVNFDLLYSRYELFHTTPTLTPIGFSRSASQGGKPETIVKAAEVDAQGNLVYAVFDNVDQRSEAEYDWSETDFVQYTLSGEHEFSDNFKIDGLVGYSHSDQDNERDVVLQLDHFNADNYSWDMRQTGQLSPVINYGFDTTDPNQYYLGPRCTTLGGPGCTPIVPGGTGPTGPEIRVRPNWGDNKSRVAELNGEYRWRDLWRFRGGAQWKKYTFYQRGERMRFGEGDIPPLPAGVTMNDVGQAYCANEHMPIPSGSPRCWIIPSFNIVNVYNAFSDQGRFETSETISSARGDNRVVEEEDQGAYVQAIFDTTVFGMPLKGDFGVRYVKTKQTSQFFTTVPTSVNPSGFVRTTVEREYDDTLPSLNLALEPREDFLVRFSAAKVMSRPGLGELSAATNVSVAGGSRTVSSGNPLLDAYRANTYDLSFEWYPTRGAILSLGLFYKDIDTYIQRVTSQAPYSTTGLPESLLAGTGVNASDIFVISNVLNTPGGPLKGYEINFQQPLTFLPGPFDDFGILLNYTHVESTIEYFLTANPAQGSVTNSLLNLSPEAWNGTLYYERGPFQARMSVNYRSEYLTAVPGRSNNPTANPPIVVDANGVAESTYVDFSSSYEVRDGLTLSFEALNITEEEELTWQDSRFQRFENLRRPGRQYYVGLRYTY